MRRRSVLALLAAEASSPSVTVRVAGEPAKMFRLGVLQPLPPGPGYRAFVQQLLALGWEEGRNLRIDFVEIRNTDEDRSRSMASELVVRGVDAIYAGGPEDVLRAAVAATRTPADRWAGAGRPRRP